MANSSVVIVFTGTPPKRDGKLICHRSGDRFEIEITNGYTGVLLNSSATRDLVKAMQAYLGELADEERTKREDAKR